MLTVHVVTIRVGSLLDHPAILQPVGSALGEEATQWKVLLRVRVAAKEETGMMGVV